MMGCRTCRARKVRCDGRRENGCRNCERLQLDCVADDGTAQSHRPSSASLRKIRTYRSCQSCRLSKTKCNGDRPRCSRCADKNVDCIYDGKSKPTWTKNLSQGSVSVIDDGQSDTPEQSVISTVENGTSATEKRANGIHHDRSSSTTSDARTVDTRNDNFSLKQLSYDSDPNSWLLSPALPTGRNLRRVVDQYFANIHPLRCFAFVHKPSFMRQLDKGSTADDEAALLHIVCAHGAKFFVMTMNGDNPPDANLLGAAGNQWAKRAEYLLLTNFGKITVQRLMTAILLHEFNFRAGEYSQALMLSGLAVRMAHALKINTEYNADIMCSESDETAPSVVSRESRRRLMWACYILDAWSGSGIDQLTLLQENDIKIQLPCNERNFGLRIASVTETLGVGHVLQFLPPSVVPRRPAANMGIMAYYIRIVTLWKKIVRYVNRLDSSTRPWLPESDFAALDSDLRLWRRELPDFVEYSTETIYARLDSNQLGALVLIHCTYHHNYLELYKLSMPDLFKLSKPLVVPPEQIEFFQSAQDNCYFHAQQIADILAEASDHGARLLSDSLLPYFVYDSSRVMLYYVARILDPNREDAQEKVRDAIHAVESNNRVLRLMSSLFPIAKSLSTTIERWLSKIRQATNREELVTQLQGEKEPEIPGVELPITSPTSPSQTNPDMTLPSISLHSLARTGIGARRAADRGRQHWNQPSPTHSTPWDRNTAAQQLVGMSRESPVRSGLQHERPVSKTTVQARRHTQQNQPMCEALDLDDLQNFLSWDMYGIRDMDMGDPVSDDATEDFTAHPWAGAI